MLIKIITKIILFIKIFLNEKAFYLNCQSQNNNKENIYLKKISNKIESKSFLEIGFHHLEFNCVGLIQKNFSGLLIDGGRKINIFSMKFILFLIKKKVVVRNLYVTKKNIKKIINRNYGCISIDIDGNDFWIVKELLKYNCNPEVFIVEYNASFLNKNISSLYRENFNRFEEHSSGLYHGASLSAFIKLFKKNDYKLIKTIGGVNAFFVKKRNLNFKKFKELSFNSGYREGVLRNKWSKTDAKTQYKLIKKLKFKNV